MAAATSLHRWRWPAAVAGGVLVVGALLVWALSVSPAAGRAALVVSILGVAVPVVLWGVDFVSGRTRPAPQSGEPPRPAGARLVIGDDGHFVGGDGGAATDAVLDVLRQPVDERVVHVEAQPLQDRSFARQQPDAYERLRQGTAALERRANLLLGGRVHYYWKWQVEDLVGAILELRAIALPAQYAREAWYVWAPGHAGQAVTLWLDEASADSLRTGFYENDGFALSRNDDERSMPTGRPIWLRQIFPSIVWTRIVPAVLSSLDDADGAWDGSPVDLSSWLLSDRAPATLSRTNAPPLKPGFEPAAWSW